MKKKARASQASNDSTAHAITELYAIEAELDVLRLALDSEYEPGSVVCDRIRERLSQAIETLTRSATKPTHMTKVAS